MNRQNIGLIVIIICIVTFLGGYYIYNLSPMTDSEYISKITVLNDRDILILNDTIAVINQADEGNMSAEDALIILEEDKTKLQSIIDETNSIEPPQNYTKAHEYYQSYLNYLMQSIDKTISTLKAGDSDLYPSRLLIRKARADYNKSIEEINKKVSFNVNESFAEFNSTF